MSKVAVLLSGCGFLDGSEVHEAVLTLLALDQKHASAVCCAPNIEQPRTIDHATHKPAEERRHVLSESARIARGAVRDVAGVRAADIDALIMPGGFGAARNLSTFAEHGADCTIHPAVERLISEMLAARKPIGAICIAPVVLARAAGKRGVKASLTIGADTNTAHAIVAMGCVHETRPVNEITVDVHHKLVTTPAYMLGKGPAEVFEGIRKLVDMVLAMV